MYNKYIKLKTYIIDNKIWLNSKYIKNKHNKKLKVKFFYTL